MSLADGLNHRLEDQGTNEQPEHGSENGGYLHAAFWHVASLAKRFMKGKATNPDVVPCPDCGHSLSQDQLGIICAGCGVRLWFANCDGPHTTEQMREAVTGLLWGARQKPSKPTR